MAFVPPAPPAGSHVARKRFGQHFLVDQTVIAAIVRAIDPRPGQALVEIGPGLGALTLPLLDCGANLTVVELDRDLARRWRAHGRMGVIEGDVLKVDFRALAAATGQRLRIVGNLPYNISSPILFHLLDVADAVLDEHFMLQREVVERIVAAPSTAAYGRLSVMLQWRYRAEALLTVPARALDPPPRVESAVVRLVPRDDSAGVDAALLSELVRIAFSQRRKLLRHTLGRWLTTKQNAPRFDEQRRAEEVPVAEYVALAAALGRC